MIGGLMKTTSRLTIATAFAAFATTGAMAADLGGNCCSDLEERIAELEATTVRKGNRKVSLEVSGHVNEAVIFWDDGVESDIYQVTNVQSRTRFRFKGSAKINADWSAGFLIEIGMSRPGSSLNYDRNNDDLGLTATGLDVRHQALYVKSKSIGTVWMGHTSDATDGITQICLGCSMGNYGSTAFEDIANNVTLRLAGGAVSTLTVGNTMFSAEGTRQSLVRYISPELHGFVFSAHWADENVDRGNGYGFALRYANEFNGVRIAGGVGYAVARDEANEGTEIGGSLSIAHVASGLYVAASYGVEDDEGNVNPALSFEDTVWHIAAGINFKASQLGKTHIGGYYANFDSSEGTINRQINGLPVSVDADVFGLAINQKIDAAAMEVYVQYHHYSAEFQTTAVRGDFEDVNVVMAGARIKF